jgi:hypothetical protein
MILKLVKIYADRFKLLNALTSLISASYLLYQHYLEQHLLHT